MRVQSRGRSAVLALMLAAAFVLGMPNQADAGFAVRLDDGAGGAAAVIVNDGDLLDSDGDANEIGINMVTVGNLTFTMTVALTNTSGVDGVAFIDTGTDFVTNNSAGAVNFEITASATGFTTPSSPPDLMAFSDSTGNLGATPLNATSTVAFAAFASSTDTLFVETTAIGSGGYTLQNPGQGSKTDSDVQTFTQATTPYSLTYKVTGSLSASARVDVDGGLVITNVPEPATMSLAFTALPFLGIAGYRRWRRSKQA